MQPSKKRLRLMHCAGRTDWHTWRTFVEQACPLYKLTWFCGRCNINHTKMVFNKTGSKRKQNCSYQTALHNNTTEITVNQLIERSSFAIAPNVTLNDLVAQYTTPMEIETICYELNINQPFIGLLHHFKEKYIQSSKVSFR